MAATIPAAAQPTPQGKPQQHLAFVGPDGKLTQTGLLFLQGLWQRNLAGNRIIPCHAAGTNVITLTPLGAHPLIEGYRSYDAFAFTAANTSTGAVTATVVPDVGTLGTIKAYKTNGAAQAGSGDVVANSFYLAFFCDHLDGGAGGLVLK